MKINTSSLRIRRFCICCFCIRSIFKTVSSPVRALDCCVFNWFWPWDPSKRRTDFPIELPGILGGAKIDAALDGFSVFFEKYCSPLSVCCFKFWRNGLIFFKRNWKSEMIFLTTYSRKRTHKNKDFLFSTLLLHIFKNQFHEPNQHV